MMGVVIMAKRLLILSCSQRKRPDAGLLPAIERYDGPQFQVLRKFVREYPVEARSLNTYILSAKFGLIPASEPIPDYDHKMTPERASKLNSQVLPDFKQILQDQFYNELFIGLGKNYLSALAGYEQVIPANSRIIVSQGSQGRRQAELRDWLYSKLPGQPSNQTTESPGGKACIRGVEITLTPEQVLDEVRKLLGNGQNNSTSYHSWYIAVDDQRVAPKWLVSQLTGLPVGAFHTGDAKRVLQQLGIEVHKV